MKFEATAGIFCEAMAVEPFSPEYSFLILHGGRHRAVSIGSSVLVGGGKAHWSD